MGGACSGGTCSGGVSNFGGAWSGEVPAPGGVPAPVGLIQGGCLLLADVLVETPPQTATAAGGTHPTGMQSCTGRERLIRSHSSARFCFELSGNSN